MTTNVTLPPKPYNLYTLGGQTAALYELLVATPDTFSAACTDAQRVMQILDMPHSQSLQQSVVSFQDFEDFRSATYEACEDPLRAEVENLARHPAPWRLRAENIPDVGAFRVFAEKGSVPEDAAENLIAAAQRYRKHADSLELSLSERAELALVIWQYNRGHPMQPSNRQVSQLEPLLASYGLSLEFSSSFNSNDLDCTAFRNAFQLDLMRAYHGVAQGSLAESLADNEVPRWMSKIPSDIDRFEGLTRDMVDELYRVGLIDKKLHYEIGSEISASHGLNLSWDPPPNDAPAAPTES